MRQKAKLVLIGLVVNYGLFILCSQIFKLPVWFDTTGTVLVAIFGGFVPSACVGILSTAVLVMYITGDGLVNYHEVIGFNPFAQRGFPCSYRICLRCSPPTCRSRWTWRLSCLRAIKS